MNSSEKNARIVWRTKSVDVTRVIPSRCATSVATVDLPVPVAPPTSTTSGTSSSSQLAGSGGAGRRDGAPSSLAEHLDRELLDPVEVGASAAASRRGPARRGARARTRRATPSPVRDQRARHQALRVRQPRRSPSGSGSQRRRSGITPHHLRLAARRARAARRRGRLARRAARRRCRRTRRRRRARPPPRRRRRSPPP